jgi:hypothetical protein
MSRNKSNKFVVLKRRMLVATARLRGYTIEEIPVLLAKTDDFKNPATGKPYSASIVRNDLKEIEKQWQQYAVETMDKYKMRLLAEINLVRKAAWKDERLNFVLEAIKHEQLLLNEIKQESEQEKYKKEEFKIKEITNDPIEASRIYQRFIKEGQ